MRGEFARLAGYAVPGQVGGRGAQHLHHVAQALRDQLGILQLVAQGDDHVEPVLQQVGAMLGQRQVELHLRVTLGIAAGQRGQQLDAEPGDRVHAQAAAWLDARTAGLQLGLLELGEDLPAALDIARAGFAQGQAPCGAVQQPGLQVVFQLRDQPRHLCGRHAALLGGSGERAGIDDPDKGPHGVHQVHRLLPLA